MPSTTSILLWITLLASGLATAYREGEGNQDLSRRDCGESDSLCTLYNAAVKGQTGATTDAESVIIPRAVVNAHRGTSSADASLGQRVGGLTPVLVAGSLVWAFAM